MLSYYMTELILMMTNLYLLSLHCNDDEDPLQDDLAFSIICLSCNNYPQETHIDQLHDALLFPFVNKMDVSFTVVYSLLVCFVFCLVSCCAVRCYVAYIHT
jgi:hypothetical protein